MSNVQNPFTSVAPLPPPPSTPSPAPAPATIHRPAARSAPPHPQPKRRSFRRNFLDRQDPFESAGKLMERYTFNGSYELPLDESPQQVVDEIQSEIYDSLAEGNLADAELEIVDLDDAELPSEASRRFVVTSTDTPRKTLVTVNAYFQARGQHLYYSVRSYVLSPLSIFKLLLAVVCSALLLWISIDLGTDEVKAWSPVPLMIATMIWIVYFHRFLRDVFAGDRLSTALRKQFPKRFDRGTFNTDDVLGFLKTNLGLTIGTLARVLRKHGVDIQGLLTIMQTIQINNNSIDNRGGSMIGGIINGAGVQVNGAIVP